jgi:SAM-dependent methyltransferase
MARRNPTLQRPTVRRVPGRASRLGARRSSEVPRARDPRLEVVGENLEQDTIAPQRAGSEPAANAALRRYWDADSATYDLWAEHGAVSPIERAAWAYELSRFLPQRRGARLLDIGAGTGFLSLAAARLGYRVTALDISPGMLTCLETSAAREGLEIETVCAPADAPPQGPFDAVIERLALWTLPDPASALRAWKRVVAPGGHLLVFEGMWAEGGLAAVRRRGGALLQGLRHSPPEHHGPYPSELLEALPLVSDHSPNSILAQLQAAGWGNPEFARLREVEFARRASLSQVERLFGVTTEYVIQAHPDGARAQLSASVVA